MIEHSDLSEQCDLSWQLPNSLLGVVPTTPPLQEPTSLITPASGDHLRICVMALTICWPQPQCTWHLYPQVIDQAAQGNDVHASFSDL